MKTFKTILKILGDVLLGIIVVIGLTFVVSLLPVKNNYKLLTVMSGSMEPAIKTGSLIFSQPSSEYKVGDIITFHPKSATTKKETVTHRISGVIQVAGADAFTTKGDGNKSNDGGEVGQAQILGRYVFKIPYLGYLLAFIKTLPGLVILIIIPATIIIYEEFKKITHEAKMISKIRREKTKEQQW